MATNKYINIVVDSKKAESNVNSLDRSMVGLGKDTDKTTAAMGALSKAAAAVAAALSVRQVIAYSDAWTSVNNKLANSIRANEQLADVTQRVFNIAQETRSSLDATASLYSRLERATREYNTSAEDLTRLTKTINQGFIVSGATAQEAENAVIQLSQGLAAGALRGEEFNSVNEQGNRLIVALSASLGVSVGKMRDLAAQGKLTTDVIVNGLLRQSDVIENEYEKTITTFAQSTQVATQNLTKFIGESTLVQSSVAAFGSAMVSVSGSIDEFTDAAIALAVVSIARVLPAMAKKEAAAISSTIASIGAAKADVTAAAATLRRAEAEKIAALAIVSTAKLDFQAAQNSNAYAFAKDNLARASSRAATAVGAYNAAAAASVAASARASIAARTLSGVMSLFGGPLGVALIAASALVYFYTTAETAEEKTKRLASEIDQLAESFSGLNRIQRAVEISKINTEMSELRSQLIRANNQLNNWTEQLNSGNPFAAQKVQQFKSEVEGLNEQLDTLSTKQQAIFQGGLPEISTSPSATSPTGDGSGAVIADSEFQSKLDEETRQLKLNLQLRQAIRDEFITYDQARAIEVATNKLANQQATFDAEILKLGENEAAKAELLATFREAQKLAVAEFELSLTDIVSEESERRNQIKQREATQAIGTYSNYANAALSLESAFGSKSEKAQKRRRKAAVIIDTAAGIGRAFAENNFYVALGMSAAIAANGIAQIAAINSASSAPQSNVSAGGIPSDSAAAPSAPTSSTVIDFRARPGQSFTADDVRDILGSVEGVTLINNGLENARRLGEI